MATANAITADPLATIAATWSWSVLGSESAPRLVRFEAAGRNQADLLMLKGYFTFDILERACRRQLENGRLEAIATHSDLADSIGSSREVVSRALKDLRVARIVETVPGVVRVNDPGRLAGIVRGFEFQVTHSVA